LRAGVTVERLRPTSDVGTLMIRVGPAGYPEGSKGPVDAVEKVGALGLDALEVQFVRQAKMAEDKATALGARARQLGVALSAHAPYYINFNSENKETVRKSSEWVMKSARLAGLMGAYVIVIHAAAYSGRPSKATAAVTKGIGKCRDAMQKEGIENVLLGLETMGKKGSWGTLDEIEDVQAKVEGVVPVVDWAHLHARDGGWLDSEERFLEILDRAGTMSGGLLHCHFSCIEYTEAGERRHLDLKAKDPDYGLLVEALHNWSGNLTLISETPSPEQGAKEMARMLAEFRRERAKA
jgi:deoxyribonuclease-4